MVRPRSLRAYVAVIFLVERFRRAVPSFARVNHVIREVGIVLVEGHPSPLPPGLSISETTSPL